MKELAIFLQAVKGFADFQSIADKGQETDKGEEAKKDTYTEAPQKGNWWDSFICALGHGKYFWSTGTCEFKNAVNWRR